MSQLNVLNTYIGLKFIHVKKKLLFQQNYTIKILERFEMNAGHSFQTPIVEGTQLTTKIGTKTIDIMFYQQLVGSLGFLTRICYDIVFVVSTMNRFLKNPQQTHLKATQ
jgi:hypothetical protein